MTNSLPEPVRLVVWDLDETFWRGTVTEGGITYSHVNHEIVMELARRGIMSSICSKNDFGAIKKIFEENLLWEYFIFPSINWESKGPRLAALIDAAQLRPASVMFIDDNVNNRQEARHFVPDLQIEDETFIPKLLEDPRFRGKTDRDLTRLKQYKLLEEKQKDLAVSGDNIEFLRGSGIKVTIDYNIEDNIDRAVELINRTNQLNYTKLRLPEEPVAAAAELRRQLAERNFQAGLIHVKDNYGDYGYVGFYMMDTAAHWLTHYCFSCRTLGMLIEAWLYERLRRPRLNTVGEVLTDLSIPYEYIDWITVESEKTSTVAAKKKKLTVFVRGGCDISSIAHFLDLEMSRVVGEFNYDRNGLPIRLDHSAFLRYALSGLSKEELAAVESLHYQKSDFESALKKERKPFDACLFSFWTDASHSTYKHNQTGIRVPFSLAGGWDNALNMFDQYEDKIIKFIPNFDIFYPILVNLKLNFKYTSDSSQFAKQNIRYIIDSIPESTKIIFMEAPKLAPPNSGQKTIDHFVKFNTLVREIAEDRKNTYFIQITDFTESPDDWIDATHFNRLVYYRVYQKISEILSRPNTFSIFRSANAAVSYAR